MGGKGSGGGRGYSLPLQLTREMKIAFDKLKVQLESADDFPVALRVFRAGLIAYEVLDEDALQAMYVRGKVTADEAQFLIEAELCKDFRPMKVEAIHEAEELVRLNKFFGQVLEQWDTIRESSKISHLERARKYPMLPNAVKLVKLVKQTALTEAGK